MPPELIAGRYRVEREVGRGGMGSVWLCRDERLGRPVAVKQVGGLPGESNMHIARALREARHSAALNHPNVVSIFDALEEGDHLWLVMEYVPSRTLSQIIRREGSVEPVRAAWIGAQVADGLAAAHARGTIHRDVKPGNILVRDDDLAKISDFGIARTVGEEQLTRSGLVTGTPVYFSPELARGEEPAPASDVWAMGATLYAAVEGRPPYPEQTNAIAMLTTIAKERPPRPRQAGVLEEPIARMLDADPAARWTMAQVAHALHGIHDEQVSPDQEERTTVLPVPVPESAAEPVREPVYVAEPTSGITAAPAAAAAASAGPPPDTRPSQQVGDDERRRGPVLVVVLAMILLLLMVGGGYLLLRDTDDPSPTAGSDRRSASASQSQSPEQSSSASASSSASESTPSSEATPSETSPTSSAPSTTPVGGTSFTGSRMAFVEYYYGFLPEDTDTAWSLLSPELQEEIGINSYTGFWRTIDDVQVDTTRPSGSDGVLVTLTYFKDGGSEREQRTLQLERTDNGYLISGQQLS
jgi:serine/threonine protein kinase